VSEEGEGERVRESVFVFVVLVTPDQGEDETGRVKLMWILVTHGLAV
jgi:hypothetical protein